MAVPGAIVYIYLKGWQNVSLQVSALPTEESSCLYKFPVQSEKKHIERVHPAHVAQYEGFVAGSRKCRADNVSGQSGPSGKKVCQQQQLIT